MKTKIAVKYLIILSFILTSSNAIAEESGDLYFGANFGRITNNSYSVYNYRTGIIPEGLEFMEDCFCDGLSSVNDNFYGGLNLEYVIFSNKIWSNNLVSTIAYNKNNILVDDGEYWHEIKYKNPESIDGYIYTVITKTMDIDLVLLDLDLLYKMKFNTFVQFGLNVGPYISIPASVKATEKISIKKAYNYSEEVLKHDTIPERDLVYDVKMDEINPYWGIRSNLFLEYEFLESFKATTEAGLSYSMSYLIENIKWDINSIYLNFRISYKLN